MASTSTSTRKGKKGKGAKAAPFRGGTPGHTALIKNSLQLSTNSSAIAGVIDVLRGQLAALDDGELWLAEVVRSGSFSLHLVVCYIVGVVVVVTL